MRNIVLHRQHRARTTLGHIIETDPQLKGANYVCVGPHGCVAMLQPFGATVLVEKLGRGVRRSDRETQNQ